jgi:hypothetical protein
MRLFTEKLKLPPAIFPSKVYSGKGPASRTVRYFVDRNPIFVSPAAEGGAPVVSFAYIDASKETTAGFRTYLVQYRSLLRALGKSRLVYVANSAQRFEQAGRDFAKLLGLNEETNPLGRVDGARLREHFEARACHERRDYRGFDMAKLDRLSRELREFKGPAFEALFGFSRGHNAGRTHASEGHADDAAGRFREGIDSVFVLLSGAGVSGELSKKAPREQFTPGSWAAAGTGKRWEDPGSVPLARHRP